MSKTIALLRSPDPGITSCELTHLPRGSIDFELVSEQHAAYAGILNKLGIEIEMIPELKGAADGVFVEDTAIVLDELAIICRPGVDSRRSETSSVWVALAPHRKIIIEISQPATLDGGDFLRINKEIYVGHSTRTNVAAFYQLKSLLKPYGYNVTTVEVIKCLHLKTAVCYLGDNTILLNPEWVDKSHFSKMKVIEVDSSEAFAANAIRFKDTIIHASGFPGTTHKLIEAGFKVESILISELEKAEAGLTCLSLIFGEEKC